MTAPDSVGFDEYLARLGRVGTRAAPGPNEAERLIRDAAAALESLAAIDRDTLTAVVAANPDYVPVLGLALGLSHERLKNELTMLLGSSGYKVLARERPADLVAAMDAEFGLLEALDVQRGETYTFADILVARNSGRGSAGRAIAAGRAAEDAVEAVVTDLGLAYRLRTRFVGSRGQDGPSDVAIPEGGELARIVCGVKAFDSTGSKLSDAFGEIKNMSEVRRPDQYLFAVVDGMAWHNRKRDLRRIHALYETRAIDGLYTLSMLDDFRRDVREAAIRVGMLPATTS